MGIKISIKIALLILVAIVIGSLMARCNYLGNRLDELKASLAIQNEAVQRLKLDTAKYKSELKEANTKEHESIVKDFAPLKDSPKIDTCQSELKEVKRLLKIFIAK